MPRERVVSIVVAHHCACGSWEELRGRVTPEKAREFLRDFEERHAPHERESPTLTLSPSLEARG